MQPSSESSRSDDDIKLRRGPWTEEEDALLIHYIAHHGEGQWNLLAKSSGLRRTGKSCRLRWLNYLKPDVKRGNLTPQEQLLILELHLKWGNSWSKIAKHLPGRTDNEIKNYWRTRVQKQARNLKIDSNSAAFQQLIRDFWVPRLLQKIHGSPQNPQLLNRASQEPSPISVYEPQYNTSHQTQTNSSSNSTESTCFSPLPPLAECPSNPFHGIGDSAYDNSPKGNYHYDNSGYGMEAFSPPLFSGPGDFRGFIDYDQIGEGNSSMDDFSVDSLWSMDDLWLSRQLQDKGD